jgi:hypothetical protein
MSLERITATDNGIQEKITTVQETRWTGTQAWDTKSHTNLSSGKAQKSREAGITFVGVKSIKSKLVKFYPTDKK